ncbi:MAG: hypothetical protein R2800_08710 [Flavipsychrobacter sp.]
MKQLIIIIAALTVTTATLAQNANTAATQSAKLALSNAIDISFVNNGTSTGATTTLSFNTVNDYANGVESAPIYLKVRSNKKFIVKAKTNSNKFTYAGSESPAPSMNVQNNLFIKVVSNNTGGNVPNAVNNVYKTLKKSNRKIINNGTPGGNNTFAVQYKADPGFEFPAGTYTVDVVYTATQK